MTRFQAYLAGIGLVAAGIGLVLTGALTKNDTLLGFGVGLTTSGLTSLGVPRPADM